MLVELRKSCADIFICNCPLSCHSRENGNPCIFCHCDESAYADEEAISLFDESDREVFIFIVFKKL